MSTCQIIDLSAVSQFEAELLPLGVWCFVIHGKHGSELVLTDTKQAQQLARFIQNESGPR